MKIGHRPTDTAAAMRTNVPAAGCGVDRTPAPDNNRRHDRRPRRARVHDARVHDARVHDARVHDARLHVARMHVARRVAPWLATTAVATWAVGCGGAAAAEPTLPVMADEPIASGPVHARGDSSVSARVGSQGGALELTNGARLEIPAGALTEEIEVVFAHGASTQVFSGQDHERPVGPTLAVSPAMVAAPDHHFVVSVPINLLPDGFGNDDLGLAAEVVDEDQRDLHLGGTQTRWEYGPAHAATGRAIAEIETLGGQRLQFVVSR